VHPIDPDSRCRPELFEMLGRVLLTLKKIHCLDSMPRLDWWITVGDHLAIEWFKGAFPAEIADRLAASCHDEEIEELHDTCVAGRWSPDENASLVILWINGVCVELRGHESIGFEEARTAAFNRVLEYGKETLAQTSCGSQ
jgi:hypothetical protein